MKNPNFIWLILALLVFLLGVPIADDLGAAGGPFVRAFLFSCMLGIGVISLRGAGKVFLVAMTMAALGIVLSIAAAQSASTPLVYVSFLAILVFLVISIGFTFRQIALEKDINSNRIVGAIAVYLMLGVVWAILYTLVNMTWPGAFRGFDAGASTHWASEWLYFSFVTMTTLGYGDIAPVTALARFLAYLQAIVGQLYIAILVAGLVGSYVSRESHAGDD